VDGIVLVERKGDTIKLFDPDKRPMQDSIRLYFDSDWQWKPLRINK
jgi:hypothetical protein